jgi:hypothetical protein
MPLQCSVHLKSVLAVLRMPHAALDRLAVSLPDPDAPKLQFTLHCLNGKSSLIFRAVGALFPSCFPPFSLFWRALLPLVVKFLVILFFPNFSSPGGLLIV